MYYLLVNVIIGLTICLKCAEKIMTCFCTLVGYINLQLTILECCEVDQVERQLNIFLMLNSENRVGGVR